jgi:GNAT superfamily N-acetyltransferase
VDDAEALAGVEIDCWRDAYPDLVPTGYLIHSLDHRQRAATRRRRLKRAADNTLVAVTRDRRRVVGYATYGSTRLPSLPFANEVYELYVMADFRGFGIGRQLCQSVAQRLIRKGIQSLCVEVLERNGSRFFYEAIGGRLAGRRDHPFAGTLLPTIIYGWADLQALAGAATSAASRPPQRNGSPRAS